MNEPTTGYEQLTLEAAQPIDDVCDQFESAWRRGERPDIAAFLAQRPDADGSVLVRELIILDVVFRRGAGEEPTPNDYHGRFPNLDAAWLAGVVHAPTVLEGRAPPAGPAGLPHEVPGFEIVGEIGRGGMGVVVKARDVRLDRPVALKFLRPEARDPARLERFRREARAASALNHPAVCTLHDLGEVDGRPFLVLEWVEGQTLREWARGRPDLDRLLPVARQTAEALRAAHAAGIVHRDLKPENLMVRPDGYVKVLDFGLARLAAGAETSTDSETGLFIGTARYMSPEQAAGQPVGSASDVYSLGVVLYELAAGRHPLDAGAAPVRTLNPELPAALGELIGQMLQRDPLRRPTAAEAEAVLGELSAGGSGRPPVVRDRRPTVGRDGEHAALRDLFDRAAAGQGSVACVSGEPGIGKTTLVEGAIAGLAADGRAFAAARGRCSERLAGADAYLPFLEALDGLLAGEAGEAAARALRLVAPSWHALVGAEASAAVSQERLKRELVALLGEVTRARPVVLFLDDVHWADASTVDLLAYLGDRAAALRLLVVVTYRPGELSAGPHPFRAVKLALQGRGLCRELTLPHLSRGDLDRFLEITFAGHAFPAGFADAVFTTTGGNPLFMTDLLRDLRDRGVVEPSGPGWRLARPLPDLYSELPESIRGLVQRKIDGLDEAERQLLLAAAVQGNEFDAAPVARVLGREPAEVEERLDSLDRVHGLVRLLREREYPDGTLTLRYAFVHAVYQNALEAALPPTRRAAWSAVTARAILSHHGDNHAPAATELALLFDAARDRDRAARFFRMAAENAVRVSAHREAACLADRGLAQLARLPESAERDAQELALLLARGVSLIATEGFAAPGVEETYARALIVGDRTGGAATLFPVLYGLWNVHLLRCELGACNGLAARMLELGAGRSDLVLMLQALNVRQQPLVHQGEFADARRHQDAALAVYDPRSHGALTDLYGEDPGVGCLSYRALTLWHLGEADEAAAAADAAQKLAAELGYPFNVARALYFAAFTRLCRREPAAVAALAEELTALGDEQGFALHSAGGRIYRGWSLAETGHAADGIRQMRDGLARWRRTGSRSHYPFFLALLGEALGRAGASVEGLATVEEALAAAAATEERFYLPELHRLRGELLARQTKADRAAVEMCFRQALDLARRQLARSAERRAADSLARHCGQ